MPLLNPTELIKAAQKNGTAIVSFNVHNLETIQGVIEGAYIENSPVIIQTTPGTLKHTGIEYIYEIVKTASLMYDIPIALHVDHCRDFKLIMECIRHGYTSVMIDASHLPYKENIKAVKHVVECAHAVGVAVEGELGRIGGIEDTIAEKDRTLLFTVPEEAKDFIDKTGIDTLAVAIGTAHGMYKGKPNLDFDRLIKIKEKVDIPLVLHGASGLSDEQIKESLKYGVAKINIATDLKIAMAKAIRDTLICTSEYDPRNYMGAAKQAIREVVIQKIRLCRQN